MIQKICSPETLGQALRAERKQKGMSQKTVGHSVGMCQRRPEMGLLLAL